MKKIKKIRLIEKKNKKLDIREHKYKIKFMKYLIEHPEQRLWQIISNFGRTKFTYILGSTHWDSQMFDPKYMEKNNVDIWDLYYYEK